MVMKFRFINVSLNIKVTGRSEAEKCSLLPLFCQKSKNQKNNSTQITN